jgi:hypothetical protein
MFKQCQQLDRMRHERMLVLGKKLHDELSRPAMSDPTAAERLASLTTSTSSLTKADPERVEQGSYLEACIKATEE